MMPWGAFGDVGAAHPVRGALLRGHVQQMAQDLVSDGAQVGGSGAQIGIVESLPGARPGRDRVRPGAGGATALFQNSRPDRTQQRFVL